MNQFINNPNLPQNPVNTVIIGEKYTETREELQQFGIDVLTVTENNFLEYEISNHSDMLFLHTGINKILIDENQYDLQKKLENKGFLVFPKKGIKSPFPHDVLLNKLIIGNYILGRSINELSEIKLKHLEVKQGYAKCSVCIVDETSVITDDLGIGTLLKNYQFDVLTVKKGSIYLSDTHYGFIGGACGKIDKYLLYFNGNLEEHDDYNKIIEFLNKHHVKPVYNKNRRLTDIGGIIPIIETI